MDLGVTPRFCLTPKPGFFAVTTHLACVSVAEMQILFQDGRVIAVPIPHPPVKCRHPAG